MFLGPKLTKQYKSNKHFSHVISENLFIKSIAEDDFSLIEVKILFYHFFFRYSYWSCNRKG